MARTLSGISPRTLTFLRVFDTTADMGNDETVYGTGHEHQAFALIRDSDGFGTPQIRVLTFVGSAGPPLVPPVWSLISGDVSAAANAAAIAATNEALADVLESPVELELTAASGVGISWEPVAPIESGRIRSNAVSASAAAALFLPAGYQRSLVTANVTDSATPSRILTVALYRRSTGGSPTLIATRLSDGSGVAHDIGFPLSPAVIGPTTLIVKVTTPGVGGVFLHWNYSVMEF